MVMKVIGRFGKILTLCVALVSGGDQFYLTTGTYTDATAHESVCVAEFGTGAVIADWTLHLKNVIGAWNMGALCDYLEIPVTFNVNYFWVNNNGAEYFGTTSRRYFFERHNGNPPSNWAVHDILGDITLGSWYSSGKVLCVQQYGPTGAPSPSPTVSPTISPTLSPTPISRFIEICMLDMLGDGWSQAVDLSVTTDGLTELIPLDCECACHQISSSSETMLLQWRHH